MPLLLRDDTAEANVITVVIASMGAICTIFPWR